MNDSADGSAPSSTSAPGLRLWSRFHYSTLFQLSIGLLMALLWGYFTYRHMLAFHQSDEWMYLLIGISESLTAGFFLFRSAPVTISTAPMDSVYAMAGTFAPLFLMPSDYGLLPGAEYLIGAGIVLQIFGLLSLNRSFAMVAAKRKLKSGGMYRIVRHPLYASYLLVLSGYALANTTWANFLLCCVTISLLLERLRREEKHLLQDPDYREYTHKVRFRMIPFVF